MNSRLSVDPCERAINILEDDNEVSDNEMVEIIGLFTEKPAVATAYAAIKTKGRRTRYAQTMLEKFQAASGVF